MIDKTPLEDWIAGITLGGAFDAGRLRDWQMARIRETVGLARKKSPFYRRLLAGTRLPQRPEDLADLPFTCPDDVRKEGLRFICVPQGEIARVVTLDTSGTSGPPKRIYFTKSDQELTVEFFRHGMSVFTRPGQRVLILLPCHREGCVGDLLHTALLRLGANPVKHGVIQSLPETLEAIGAGRIDALVGIPAQVNALARYAAWAGREVKLANALLTTDHVPEAVAANVAARFGCEVFGHYGMTEMGLGGGVECSAHAGYHAFAADIYFEVVDPVSLRPVPDGEYGEVVITTLRRRGMPLIRYRTGDVSRILPGACPCGSSLLRLERLTRRLGTGVRLHADELHLCDLDETLFSLPGLLDFTAAVSGPAPCRRLYVHAAVMDAPNSPGPGDVAGALSRIGAVARAAKQGCLTVETEVSKVSDWVWLHAGKRRIVCEEGVGR